MLYADERLNDIVGSAYYVAPEVLHRSYSLEADIWSIGVITYILLCGSRPFWARTESGIFRAVLRADPNFEDSPWPSVSAEAKDFVKRLLNKDYRKRMTAVQALSKLLVSWCYLWKSRMYYLRSMDTRHWHRHDATGDTATSILEKLGHGTVGIWQLIINIYL